MLALFGNIAPLEVLVILGLAVVLFGARLPEVAGKVYTQFRRMREALDRFRRDTGIDRELREIERNVRDAAWRKDLRSSLEPPSSEPAAGERPDVPHVIERSDIGLGREAPALDEEPASQDSGGAESKPEGDAHGDPTKT